LDHKSSLPSSGGDLRQLALRETYVAHMLSKHSLKLVPARKICLKIGGNLMRYLLEIPVRIEAHKGVLCAFKSDIELS
jgi:hypothetical protein